jgi:formylglycine-generating enzyme required for sulfatase activity
VTNAQFAAFLSEQGNQEEGGARWLDIESGSALIEESGGSFQAQAGFEEHPVIMVTWYGSNAYCQWVGGQLPTEAQWEYAARSSGGNIFPWGDDFEGTRLNYCDNNCEFDWKDETVDDGYARTAPVGSYPAGDSWVGAQDMAGNVWEWTADWYEANYYESSPINNPTGPAIGDFKVLRGGSWDNNPYVVRGANRSVNAPDFRFSVVGFRCVVEPGS